MGTVLIRLIRLIRLILEMWGQEKDRNWQFSISSLLCCFGFQTDQTDRRINAVPIDVLAERGDGSLTDQ
jgi:hypothetical protein